MTPIEIKHFLWCHRNMTQVLAPYKYGGYCDIKEILLKSWTHRNVAQVMDPLKYCTTFSAIRCPRWESLPYTQQSVNITSPIVSMCRSQFANQVTSTCQALANNECPHYALLLAWCRSSLQLPLAPVKDFFSHSAFPPLYESWVQLHDSWQRFGREQVRTGLTSCHPIKVRDRGL